VWGGPAAAIALVGLTVYLAFNAGGFFPDSTAIAVLASCLLAAIALLVVRRPLAGFGPGLAVPLALLAGFAGWTLASALWSGLGWRALAEFDRALLYVLVFALFGLLGSGGRRLAWGLRGIAIAAIAICAAGWTTRVGADLWPIADNIHPERLSFPLTYWNALGLLATLGIIACVYLSSGQREGRPWRVLGAAAIPLLGSTLLLTFSRGSLAVAVLGLAVYLLLSRAPRLLSTLIAVAVPTAVSLIVSYQASVVSSARFASPDGVAEGHDVALVVLGCVAVAAILRLLLTRLDERLDTWVPPPLERRTVVAGIAAVGLACVALVVLFHVPTRVGDQYDNFVEGNVVNSTGDPRSRLTAGGNNGRLAEWDVAIEAFEGEPLRGAGAGTYPLLWDRDRSELTSVLDGHSLYIEVLGELGAVGLLLIVGALVAIFIGLGRRLASRQRQAYAAAIAVSAAWALHAGVDWDWEMPAVTLGVFALAGLGLARGPDPGGEAGGDPRRRWPPRLLGVICLVGLAIAPMGVALSQRRLDAALAAFGGGDCAAATASAHDALEIADFRAEPYLVLGYCEARQGEDAAARQAMEDAVGREPGNWRAHYGLALVRAIDGRNPLPELREAQRLNPLEPRIRLLIRGSSGGGPAQWRLQAQKASLAL
jgi:hypothetical protein